MTAFWSAIVNGAILSAALTIAVWIALRLTPRRALNAATRYAIWWIVLLATLALPLSFVQWRRYTSAPVYAQAIPLTDLEPAFPVEAPAVIPRAVLPLEIPASPWLRPMLFAWIGTALLLLIRLALSYLTLYRRTARAIPAYGTRVALSDEIDIPMAVGPFRRAILVPANLFASLTESDLRQITLHEATHLDRSDDWTLLLQRIVEALLALHPVVRWITRQLDLEREIACDDAVVRSSDTARSYADCLTRMVQACGGVRPSVAAANVADSRSHLSRRVELLMRANRTNSPRMRRRTFALIAIVLIGAAGLLANTPRLVAFAIPQNPAPVVQQPVMVVQTTRPTPPPPPEQPPQPPPPAPQLPLYRLGPNDVISVTVANEKNVTGTYTIGPDGRLSLPLIGELNAVGLTLPEFRSLIAQKLDAYIADPVVNVQLLRNNSRKFTLIGGILKPGPYPLLQETTILDALAASGGLDVLAVPDKIVLLRGQATLRPLGDGSTSFTASEVRHFNYNEAVNGIHPEQNLALQDGDILFVPLQ